MNSTALPASLADALPSDGIQSFRTRCVTGLRHEERQARQLWGASFAGVAISALVIVWYVGLPQPVIPVPAPPPAAIAIDLAPELAATSSTPTDSPPGPQQIQSQPVAAAETPPPVTAPLSPAPNPPVPVPKQDVHPVVRHKTRSVPAVRKVLPDKTPPAQQTTAPPSTDAPPSSVQTASAPGASSANQSHDPLTWQSALLARLERYKRYPAVAQGQHQEGTAMLRFRMDRKGHVLSASIAGSSGHALLDDETLALVHRAEPLPSPPDAIAGETITLTVPVEFYINQGEK
ncbi:energy transducer TonB family protein [Acetobacter musti]|uniref:energy transducer TonB family protein n=1 Tax=Acetobacter musti TaxID=864732 RepID=UPI0030D4E943